ncbi:MAG: hypothetical protein ACSHW7_08125 [Patiriisocius sp.]|uniref:hypothetical protein n=1 Tax=Patiriisocius sp. TaxID=2822396 RepID=UPI003EF6E4F3
MAVAKNSGELITHLRNGTCILSKNEDFQSRQDERQNTISEEYTIKYGDGGILYLHIHNDIGDQSYMIHVKDDSYGNSLFGLGDSWSRFLQLAWLTVGFG